MTNTFHTLPLPPIDPVRAALLAATVKAAGATLDMARCCLESEISRVDPIGSGETLATLCEACRLLDVALGNTSEA